MIVKHGIIISLVTIQRFVEMINIAEITMYFCVQDIPFEGQKIRLEACDGRSFSLFRLAMTGEIRRVEIVNADPDNLWVKVSIIKNERIVYGKDWKEEA